MLDVRLQDDYRRTVGASSYTVTREAVAAYATAIMADSTDYIGRSSAPATFAILPAWDAVGRLVTSSLPLNSIPLIIQRSHHLSMNRLLTIEETITTEAALAGVENSVLGIRLVIQARSRDSSGDIVNEQHLALLIKGAKYKGDPVHDPRAAGRRLPATATLNGSDVAAPGAGRPSAEGKVAILEHQPLLYAQASGDYMPIHVDEGAARAAGLPGKVLQGLCTLGIVAECAIGELGANAATIREVGAEFHNPVVPPCDLHYSVSNEEDPSGRVIGVRAEVDGNVVLRRGRIVLRG